MEKKNDVSTVFSVEGVSRDRQAKKTAAKKLQEERRLFYTTTVALMVNTQQTFHVSLPASSQAGLMRETAWR